MRDSVPAARTSSSPGMSAPTSLPSAATMRVSTNGSARPKQRVPRWRGSWLAMMQPAAPVSVIAQASSSGKPKRSSNAA